MSDNKQSRQVIRQQRRKDEFARLAREFGGIGPSGSHYWAANFSRRIARQIAREKARGTNVTA